MGLSERALAAQGQTAKCCVCMCVCAFAGKIMRGTTQDKCARHLHQVHVCLPAKKGHTRLLYRMSLDFLGVLRHVPFIEQVRWSG